MPLSKERQGEIASLILEKKILRDGIALKPNEIKREIKKLAQDTGISVVEAAETIKLSIERVYQATMDNIDELISSQAECHKDPILKDDLPL